MLDNRPDFFIHSGDHIYADCPVERELKLPDGEVWRNIVTEEKSVAAHTLEQFRGNYKYNWLDRNFRAFHAAVPLFAQWDDHEVTNDWAPDRHRRRNRLCRGRLARCWWRGRAARSTNSCRCARARPRRPDLSQDRLRPAARHLHARHAQLPRFQLQQARRPERGLHPRRGAAGLAEARTGGVGRDLEGDRRRHADRPVQRGRHRARRRPAGAARARDRRSIVVHEARRHPQHGVADRRHALHGGAPLRSEPRGLSGFRTVLGVRLRPAACRHLGAGAARQYVRAEGDVPEGRDEQARTSRPVSACSSSAASTSTARPK